MTRHSCIKAFVVVSVLTVLGHISYALGSQQVLCDQLTAHPADPSLPDGVVGVPFQDIDATNALNACISALRRKPFDGHLLFEVGRALDASGIPLEALKSYRLAAGHGYSQAAANLGALYVSGILVSSDKVEAIKWYRLAAEAGHPIAQFNLAVLYDQTSSESKTNEEVERWYSLAAEQGYSSAQLNLGVLYAKSGDSRSFKLSLRWFKLAAAQGNEKAQRNLQTAATLRTSAEYAGAHWLVDDLNLDR